ncbi:MAG: acyl-CoA dehydrogenase family protein [Mycobacteriales bacterium]|nr:acyl-CoA dehydrogenase family protein [Mycobacteriales bacterium]
MSELDELRAAVRDLLTDRAPVSAEATDGGLWKALSAEMGLTALGVEDVPLTWVTAVLEETGRVLLRDPLLPALVAGRALTALGDEQHLAGLADGSVTAALALDGLDQVPHADGADLLLVDRDGALHVTTTFTATPLQSLDPTRPVARIEVSASREVGSSAYCRDLRDLALAAECVGGAARVLELAVEHLKVRTQFGRPLGSFQALRHRVADLTVHVEAATSSTWFAADARDLHVAGPLARGVASEAFVTVAGEAIQLFGGIGFTWEHPAHLYFKRAWTTALLADPRDLKRLAFDRSGT